MGKVNKSAVFENLVTFNNTVECNQRRKYIWCSVNLIKNEFKKQKEFLTVKDQWNQEQTLDMDGDLSEER